MKSKLKKITYLFISLLMALLLNNTLIFNNGAQTELNIPKQSAGYSRSFIHVDGNWSATTSYDWCYGDGSWSTPYIIENVTIDAGGTGSGIFINNSLDIYFIIRNSTIHDSGNGDYDAGIKLVNVTNGKIVNNTCSNNLNDGILLMTDCNNNTIANNNANDNSDTGIYLLNNCNNNTISNNTVNNNDFGIVLLGKSSIGCDHNNILNNTAINNGVGIHLSQSGFNTVYGNRLVNNSKITFGSTSGNGIRITYYEWGGRCRNNSIENNQILFCRYGIFMYDGVSNKILNNTVNNNTIYGMYIKATNFPCVNNTIENNTISYNQQHGIYFSNSDDNYIANNAINENNQHGIYLYSCDSNTIINNTVNDNNQHGIYLLSCDSNTIINNTVNDNNQHGIYLYSCDSNTIIINTVNDNTEIGIALYYSDYNNITDNTLKDNALCLFETQCTGNLIENNDCSPPTVQEPIFINDALTVVGAHNWTWAVNQSWCSGSGIFGDPYIIENLEINGFGLANGIEIINSNVSFIIRGCLIYNSETTGIYLTNVNNSRLINNNCSNNEYGIYLYDYCSNNTISGNTANYNHEGISLDSYCSNNTISGNTANYNHEGIYLYSYCSNNTISGNTANYNSDGINLYRSDHNTISGNTANDNRLYLDHSHYNSITGNTVNNHTGDPGIYLFYSDHNTISGNTANYNGNAIGLQSSHNNTITGNTANNNDNCGIYITESLNNTIKGNKVSNNIVSGIFMEEDSDYNEISENIIYNNTIGIDIDSLNYNNTIYGNFFLKNGKHAEDDGTDNKWNSTTIGNYWDNHTGPDVNDDGIVDAPYNISRSPLIQDYLPIAEDGAPSITINSPTLSDVFGATAPSFDVTITDDYLDSMWYTLDGGLHNYTFTVNSSIEQPAWNAVSDGAVILKFYANDTLGHVGSAEVSVIKDTTAPIIVINSPTDGAEFGTQAPLFNITVTEINLDAKWYSFDGGVTTYVITDNTVFNQTAWTALPEGDVTITFYARDLAGNEASEAVTVVKIAAGLDPGIIITIVVVSIAGGVVVVAAVIYIYLKKRASPK